MVKLLIGGSPCTYWSIAQTKNRETTSDGIGWELFLNYVIARDKYKPDYFLYENNKSMATAIREQITKELGVEPVGINSALVSAQNRQRLYWVGKREADGTYSQVHIEQPEDRGILLRDILETTASEEGYALRAECINGLSGYATPVLAEHAVDAEKNQTVSRSIDEIVKKKGYLPEMFNPYNRAEVKEKSPTLSTGSMATSSCATLVIEEAGRVDVPVYQVRDGKIAVKGGEYPVKLRDGCYIIRKLTVTECKRLQTVPDEYEFPVSDSQAHKMLGNGWTVDVIAHIMSHFENLTAEPVEVLSMYDGMSCGHIALNKLGAEISTYYATEIDKYAIQATQHNFPDTIQLGDAFQVRDSEWALVSTNGGQIC